MELSSHATDKLETYGIEGERLKSWTQALLQAVRYFDTSTGSTVLVTNWEQRPWVVILSQTDERVITIYPTDERTLTNRLRGGRWCLSNKPNN